LKTARRKRERLRYGLQQTSLVKQLATPQAMRCQRKHSWRSINSRCRDRLSRSQCLLHMSGTTAQFQHLTL
jgi:hypothetical protein